MSNKFRGVQNSPGRKIFEQNVANSVQIDNAASELFNGMAKNLSRFPEVGDKIRHLGSLHKMSGSKPLDNLETIKALTQTNYSREEYKKILNK